MRAFLTILVWTAALASLAAGCTVAALFVFMPVSLDPGEIIAAGSAPWSNAAIAVSAATVLLVATGLCMRLWHSARFRPLGLFLAMAQLACVGWICLKVYADYF